MSEQSTAELRETVRARYAAAATAVVEGSVANDCCGPQAVEVDENFGSTLYSSTERDELPAAALAASLGCGNPTAVAELREGETVLDLGSGGGIDVLLSARRVGPTGKAYGVDMTEEMLALARANAAKAGATNVEFLKGTIESIPLPASTVDVVISNCVINLSVDKPAVFAETFRVLVPGGRFGVSDVIAEDTLTAAQRAERGSYVGCIAGALSMTEYRQGLETAGFTDVQITPTHQVADGMHSAIIHATKPTTAQPFTQATSPAHADTCCGVNACCTTSEQAIDPALTVAEARPPPAAAAKAEAIMPGASEQTRPVKVLNANWVAGPDGDDGRFEVMIVTDDDQHHTIAPSPTAMTALLALAQADTILLWDPTNHTLIAANIVGTWLETTDNGVRRARSASSAP